METTGCTQLWTTLIYPWYSFTHDGMGNRPLCLLVDYVKRAFFLYASWFFLYVFLYFSILFYTSSICFLYNLYMFPYFSIGMSMCRQICLVFVRHFWWTTPRRDFRPWTKEPLAEVATARGLCGMERVASERIQKKRGKLWHKRLKRFIGFISGWWCNVPMVFIVINSGY